MLLPKETTFTRHTIEDILALPEDVRAELLDGEIYYLSTPTRIHQKILIEIAFEIKQHIRDVGGPCEVYVAPFAVILPEEGGEKGSDKNADYVEPDVCVICDPEKLSDRGCEGGPDWVIEIVSPSSRGRDYFIKLVKYRAAGTRSYWIVDPAKRVVRVYDFMNEDETEDHSFEERIPSAIYPDLAIRVADYV